MRRVATYRLDDKVVNKETMALSLILRVIALVGAILLLAAVSPLSLVETFGYAAVVMLALTAKSLVVTVPD